jgi:large-conductance mechanosensitive channel
LKNIGLAIAVIIGGKAGELVKAIGDGLRTEE